MFLQVGIFSRPQKPWPIWGIACQLLVRQVLFLPWFAWLNLVLSWMTFILEEWLWSQVAEFANVRKQLEVLEDRLEEMVRPRISDALQNRKVNPSLVLLYELCLLICCWISLEYTSYLMYVRHWLVLCYTCIYFKVEDVQDLRQILVRIGRFKSLELQYIKIGIRPLRKLWEGFESRQQVNKLELEKHRDQTNSISFSSWLPSFYDEVLLYLEQEWKWYVLYSSCTFFCLIRLYLFELLIFQLQLL